jgi:3-methyl-2-oxobutanoate hydroxymethyltransferase
MNLNIHDFHSKKQNKQKISMLTCYDYWSAQLLAESSVDCLLVGDSGAMIMHGHSTTLPMEMNLMAQHVAAVARGAPTKFIIGDLPFGSYRQGQDQAVKAACQLMQAGASAVKLEGASGNLALVRHLVDSGIPVMGHLGLTPQSIYQLGGFKLQAKDEASRQRLLSDAIDLQTAGCFALVLECVPATIAKTLTEQLDIPTIGIGAGPHTDGQVLVLHDMLGLQTELKPKFLKTYLNGAELMVNAINHYVSEVQSSLYPDKEHSYDPSC